MIKKLRNSKLITNQILDVINPGHNEAEATLAICWEALFNFFCQSKELDLASLNTLSSIIHKLTTSVTQIKSLEIKTRELHIKESSVNKANHSSFSNKNNKGTSLVPLDVFNEVQQQLKLL